MTSEPRKASDILLELEKKLDIALSIIRSQDMNIKILSNKLNSIAEAVDKKSVETTKFTIESVATSSQAQFLQNEKNILISNEDTLPLEIEPQGFRRTSRPETYEGDDAYLPKQSNVPKYPVQTPASPESPAPPPGRGAETTVTVPKQPKPVQDIPNKQAPVMIHNAIPVMQRVVNGHGKSLYLANVEIIDLATMQSVLKTRTNGTGKWMASLGVGNYRVIIRKLEATTKETLEVIQDIEIDGSQSPFELQSVIIK